MKTQPLICEKRQLATAEPSAWENELADVIEATFAAGIHDLPGVVAALNKSRVRASDGNLWTEANFQAAVKRLGA